MFKRLILEHYAANSNGFISLAADAQVSVEIDVLCTSILL
jgi:hypothetical protein